MRFPHVLLAMKLTITIFFLSILGAMGSVNGQHISLKVENTTLRKVLIEIGKQSKHVLLYNEEDLNDTRNISLNFNKVALREALEEVCKGQPVQYTIKGQSIVISRIQSLPKSVLSVIPFTSVQDPVKGKVINEKGEPLAGASVYVLDAKGRRTSTHTKTDEMGAYVVPAQESGFMLEISYLGYHTEKISIRTEMGVVSLKPSPAELTEVVIVNTGYQALKANEVTGAIEVVTQEMLNQQTGVSILDRLNNVIPAIRFDNQPIQSPMRQKLNVSIRGLSTINGQLDPLIVLDGFIYEGDIANIDPNSIESVSILKDASAAAIWGSRAGNGVIVMTSKRASFQAAQRTKISFNSTFLFKNKSDLNQLYQPSNKDFYEVEKMLFNNGYYDVYLNSIAYAAMTPVIDVLDKRKKGLISSLDSARIVNNLLEQNGLQNYADAFYESPFTQQYSLSLSGSSDKHSYGFVAGYTKDKSQLDAHNGKLNILFSNSFRPLKNLQIDVSLNYTNAISKSGKPELNTLSYSGKSVPYLQFLNEVGGEIPFERDYRKLYLDQNYRNGYLDWSYYPLSEYHSSNTVSKLAELYSTFGMAYQFTSFLKLNISGQYQLESIHGENLSTLTSYFARSTINKYTQIDANGKVTYPVPQGGILKASQTDGQSYTLRGQANFDKRFGSHHLVGVVGAEMREKMQKGNSFTAYGYNEIPLTYAAVDFVTSYPTSPDNLRQNIIGVPDFSKTINRFISSYINVSNIWKEKYALSASFRKDGANIFGATTNDKWAPLWSVGAFWTISKEKFMTVNWVDELKLRLTYGYSGNVDVAKTPEPIATVLADTYTRYPVLNISTLNDPSLRWEKVGTLNIGLDFTLLHARILGSADYYFKKGEDLYGSTEYDYTGWGVRNSITKNVAGMKGRGLDFSISSKNLTGALSWGTRLNLSTHVNNTTAYYQSGSQGVLEFLGSGNRITPIVGMPLNAIAAYRWAGLNNQGAPQGYINGVKTIEYSKIKSASIDQATSAGSIRFFGSSKPQVFGNLTNTFSFRNISLEFNLSFKGDYYFLKPATNYYNLFQNGAAYPDFELRWQKAGDEQFTNTPKMDYSMSSAADSFYTQSEIHVRKGDHVRLEYINLSWLKPLELNGSKSSLRIYSNLANLGILWARNKENMDPEFAYRLRPSKVFSVGMQLNY